jgi:actin-related protein
VGLQPVKEERERFSRKPSPEDLSDKEYEIYKKFKEIIEDKKISIHDETFLIRYLQARDFVIKDSVELAIRVAKLRAERQVDKITLEQVKHEYNTGVH